MDTCSTEITTLIFEFACHGDLGRTARNLGLVSKFFRPIAERIELRSIAVFGVDQLRGLVARLAKTDGAIDNIQHLFISELSMKYALAAETDFSDQGGPYARHNFWWSKEGKKARELVNRDSEDFWRVATHLVRTCGQRLSTLYLLSSEGWGHRQIRKPGETTPMKVMGALSGSTFPHVSSIMVAHGATWDDVEIPITPSLRKLHIMAPIATNYLRRGQSSQSPRFHPLLALVQLEMSKLSHLVICDENMPPADLALKAIFGDDEVSMRRRGTLPKELCSVVLKQGVKELFDGPCGTPEISYGCRTYDFVKTIKEVGVDGLAAHLPTETYPKPGKRQIELLLELWKEDTLDPVV